jgi:cytochrome c biogenesis protein
MTTQPASPGVPAIGVTGWLRWAWRQLTSMRVALFLLMLTAVAAVPGSLLPQRGVADAGVVRYLDANPGAGAWLERLGMFSVYTSAWFSAIYLLLFVSLIGCILPRIGHHMTALRGRPPRTPSRLDRFPARAVLMSTASPDVVAGAVGAELRRRRVFRVDSGTDAQGASTVAAERGYLRESGNIVFHVALVGLLVSIALGQLLHYFGQVIVTEGRGFANAMVNFDSFTHGGWFRDDMLVPFSVTLDDFTSEFVSDVNDVAFAQSRDFTATVTVTQPDGAASQETIKVNHPLSVAGTSVYLQGNGYAPEVTVTDATGQVAFRGPVPFIPTDDFYTSEGVIKVPDVAPGLAQIGLAGNFLPSAMQESDSRWRSTFPLPDNPVLVLQVWTGNLGLDDGVPQNVYRLDTAAMTPALDASGNRVQLVVHAGETVDLPNGLGTLTLGATVPRFAALDLRHDPSQGWVLAFALLAVGGLGISLFTPRRRVWLRAVAQDDGTTRVELAGLARGDDAGLQAEVDAAAAVVPGTISTEVTDDVVETPGIGTLSVTSAQEVEVVPEEDTR